MLDKPPYGDGNDLYYQCADLILEIGAATSGSTGDGSTGDGSSDGSGSTGGTTDDAGSTGAVMTTGGASAGSTADESAGISTEAATDSDSAEPDEGCGCRGDTGDARDYGLALLLASFGLLSGARRRRARGR